MKKTKTLIKIIDASIEVFSTTHYEDVAFLKICQTADIAVGSIYNYFKTKEELFKFLLEETITRIENHFSNLQGNTIEERLLDFIQLNIDIGINESKLIKIYRAGQYHFTEYEEKLEKLFFRVLSQVYNRKLTISEFIFISSGIRYVNLSFAKTGYKIDINFLCNLILKGFFNNESLEDDFFKNNILYQMSAIDSDNKKYEIMKSGELLFSEHGYSKVTISEIMKKTNYSVGSFYNFYENKENFFSDIITATEDSKLFFLNYNSKNYNFPLEKQIIFLFLNIKFYSNSIYKYKLIREGEFVFPELSLKYYLLTEELYLESLKSLDLDFLQKKIIANYSIGISHYLGISYFFTNSLKIDINALFNQIKCYFINGIPK